jgi:hypothetical protein
LQNSQHTTERPDWTFNCREQIAVHLCDSAAGLSAAADGPLFPQTSRHQPRHARSDQQHDEEAGRLQRHDEGDMLCGGGDNGESMPPGLVAR